MELASLRLPLYYALWLFSFLLLCFTAARLHYTTHLPPGDALNGGVDFYDPIVVELLVCSLLALGIAPFVLHLVHRVASHSLFELPRGLVEPIVLSILSFLWIIGCGHSSSIWGDLSWCSQFQPCRILSAMMAFAWLGWLCLLGLQLLIFVEWFKAKKVTLASTSTTATYPAMRERSLPPPPTSEV